MGFLKRLLGGDAGIVPEWAPFEAGKDYTAFIDAVTSDLQRRGMTVEVGDGVVMAHQSGAEEPHQLGLSNLSQLCHASERDDWSRIIASHFSSLLSMQGRDLDALAADYEQVKPILRIRLMPDESMGGVELPKTVSRHIAPGILAVLVFDFPDSTATVDVDHLAGWPVDQDGVFEQALDNLASEPTPLHEDVDADEARFRVWYGDSFYVATLALRLADLLPAGATDALIAIPNRHTLIVAPIVDAGAVAAMQAIFRMAVQLFRDGPGSISDQPYWWHEGAIVQIPHREDGRKIAVYPPDDFVALLETVLARSAGE
jgi:uncharacterized protein YtpQ (UPF0354 family)